MFTHATSFNVDVVEQEYNFVLKSLPSIKRCSIVMYNCLMHKVYSTPSKWCAVLQPETQEADVSRSAYTCAGALYCTGQAAVKGVLQHIVFDD